MLRNVVARKLRYEEQQDQQKHNLARNQRPGVVSEVKEAMNVFHHGVSQDSRSVMCGGEYWIRTSGAPFGTRQFSKLFT